MPGLRPGWRAEVLDALGSYDDMIRRNLGADLLLDFASTANAPWPDGLLLPPGPR